MGKQTKTIEDQGNKHIKAIEEHGKKLIDQKYSLPLTKQEKIFENLINERLEKIENLNNDADFKKLIYHYKHASKDIDFSRFIDAKTLFNNIKLKRIKLADVVENQKEFK